MLSIDQMFNILYREESVRNQNHDTSWRIRGFSTRYIYAAYLMYKFVESEGVCSLEGLIALVALMWSEQHPRLLLLLLTL